MGKLSRPQLQEVRYETPAPGVARIVMDRPDKRNAQGVTMTYDLQKAFHYACHDDDVSVIILAGAGPHFNAGHDLSGTPPFFPEADQAVGMWGQFDADGWEGQYSREREIYLDMTERWRNAPKPTIAEVQGVCVMGGAMLAWACDLIIAAETARFRDQAGEFGGNAVEFFAHPFELGFRRAKEWLFTSDWLSAADAERFGMVNRVVADAELSQYTLALAARIAKKDRFALKLIKESVNAAQDATGRKQAMSIAFHIHQMAHLHNTVRHGRGIDVATLPPALQKGVENINREIAEVSGKKGGAG